MIATTRKQHRGFTLIELLVVMVIIGIIVGAVVLQITGADKTEALRNTISNLKNRVNYTQQRALLRNQLLGMSISQQGYRFYIYVKKNNHWHWQVVEERPLSTQVWPNDTAVNISMGNNRQQIADTNFPQKPQIIFSQTGLITPFTVSLNQRFYLRVDTQSQLTTGRGSGES